MIRYTIGNITTQVSVDKFPAGELKVNINTANDYPNYKIEDVKIHATFGGDSVNMSEEILALMMTVDAIRNNYPCARLNLLIPYIPYGRQDRVCVTGESHSIRVFANLINAMGFASVTTCDPHSTVTEALFNNLRVYTQYSLFKNIYHRWDHVWIVAPDQGAVKKAEDFAVRVNAKGVIRCLKDRDLRTGKIKKFELIDDEKIDVYSQDRYLVLDDLCDKGGTFLAVADQFEFIRHYDTGNDKMRIDLAITHGLFTSDDSVSNLLTKFDNIYTTDSFRLDIPQTFGNTDRVHVTKL